VNKQLIAKMYPWKNKDNDYFSLWYYSTY